MILFLSTLVLLLSIPVYGQDRPGGPWKRDPLADFCRRFGHATAIVNDRLFIDGGLVQWKNSGPGSLRNSSNRWLLYNDLQHNGVGNMPQLHSNFTRNQTQIPVTGGALWGDNVNKYLYQFGGEVSKDVRPSTNGLAIYDVAYNQWDYAKVPWHVRQVAWGASTTAEERGEGYYLGGWINNGTQPGMIGKQATGSLVRFDMNSNGWTNLTGPDTMGRAEGVMVYLPASSSGLLIYFGGVVDPSMNGTILGSAMNTIHIFDIASARWYTQNATGDVPDMRRRFCAGATWADDHSSYNIYLYGGLGIPPNGVGFDDVYILSLPSFTWIKWWPTSPGTGNPHHSMTCNVINRTQMIIIGGEFPLQQPGYCDYPDSWGTHNLNLGANGPRKVMWDDFFPNITRYQVPLEIIAKIGGGPTGGATVVEPKSWDNRDLAVYFSRVATFTARKPNRNLPGMTHKSRLSKSQQTGIIVGSVIGGMAVICALILLVFCCFRRRITSNPSGSTRTSRAELPASITPDLSHYIIGPDGKRFVELGEKTISEIIYPHQDVIHTTSSISQHASLQLAPNAYLYDPQNGINGALVQLYQHPSCRNSSSNSQQELPDIPLQTATIHASYCSRASSPRASPTTRYYARFSTDDISPLHAPPSVSVEIVNVNERSNWYEDEVSPASGTPSYHSYLHPSSASHRTPSRQPSVETNIPVSPTYLYPPPGHSARSLPSADGRTWSWPPSDEVLPGTAL